MEILHEWQLERYGKLDWQPQSGWIIHEKSELSLKMLSSRKLVISSESVVTECFSLFNSALWLKCFQKGDSMLILHRIKDSSRKYRLKFLASAGSSSLDICNNVVKVLRQYINVLDVTPGKTQPQTGGSQAAMDISTFHPDDILMGEVTQSQLTQAILGRSECKLPTAYSISNYPTGELDTLVRLCLIDPNFSAFVSEVEKSLTKVSARVDNNGLEPQSDLTNFP